MLTCSFLQPSPADIQVEFLAVGSSVHLGAGALWWAPHDRNTQTSPHPYSALVPTSLTPTTIVASSASAKPVLLHRASCGLLDDAAMKTNCYSVFN